MRVWTYIGDMRCPECGCYHDVKANGRGDRQALKMTCKKSGKVYVRLINTCWHTTEDVDADTTDLRIRDVKELLKIG